MAQRLIMIDKQKAYYDGERLIPHVLPLEDGIILQTRIVFLGKDIVVKIDDGNQSKKEIGIFKIVKGTVDEKYFVPIIDYGTFEFMDDRYTYVVQKKVKILSRGYDIQKHKDFECFKKRLWSFNVNDISYNNIGLNENNELIIFDYGV